MSSEYLSVKAACNMFEMDERQLLKLIRNNHMKGCDRFKEVDGEWFVRSDFKNPLANDIEKLYYVAMVTAKTECTLAKELARYEENNKTAFNRIYAFLHRFSFKHYESSKNMLALLDRYINENSLFGDQIWTS